MEKKTYERPNTEVINIETEGLMVSASNIRKVEGPLNYQGSGSGFNRVRSRSRDEWSNGWE